ncbi:ORF1 [Bemisia tabaci arlivirus 1]|uniref:ORF1 n=1 Tax=Bemisia tabaci arlivirus 1 TaxID=2840017 RepID=A0A8E8FUV3_9MONO|nr:ORF1 [Bemisia tabaci arlivirus 1]QWC36455.1 ORF1 [Bemisia tabaci arlivirus 1]
MNSGLNIVVNAHVRASTKGEDIKNNLEKLEAPTVRLSDLAIPEISWIVRDPDTDLKTHFKQLLRLYTSQETGMETSLSIGLALIGCVDLNFANDTRALLTRDAISIVPLSIDDFVQEHNFTVDWRDVNDYIDMNQRHCIYVISLLLNLIGKTLNPTNYTPWMERRTNSYGAALGFERDSTDLIKYQPSLEFCKRYNAEIRARWQLRRRCFLEAWALSKRTGPIGTAAATVLVLLRGAELTNFASIVQQLLVLHPELMGWNALAKYFPNIIKAYRKYTAMGDYADWIKLLLPDEMVEEFKTTHLKIPFTIARAVAEEYGQTTLAQAEGADQSPAIQELVQEAILIVKVSQGARTIDTQSIRHWRLGNYENKPLISLLDGTKPPTLSLPPIPSTPTIQDRMRGE